MAVSAAMRSVRVARSNMPACFFVPRRGRLVDAVIFVRVEVAVRFRLLLRGAEAARLMGDAVRMLLAPRRRVVRRRDAPAPMPRLAAFRTGAAAFRAMSLVRFVMRFAVLRAFERGVLRRALVPRFFVDAIDPPSFTRRQRRRPLEPLRSSLRRVGWWSGGRKQGAGPPPFQPPAFSAITP
jgi:hypothetical protein